MAQTRSFKVFLSAATSECGQARGEIARDLRGGRGLTVKVQEEFRQEADADTTLDLLHKYIAELGDKDEGAVVCIIGRRSGDFPPEKAAEKYAHLLPPGVTRASYTQWEFFFARHYRRRLSIYLAADDYVPDTPDASPTDDAASQQAFVDYIKREEGLNRNYFSSVDELCRAVLRQDWPQLKHKRPVLLPYQSIGTLFKGRDEFLQQLRESLQQTGEHGATAITGRAVHGLGGVGKTRLAVEYAWQHADEYSAVLFVTADSPESLRRNLAELVGPLVLDLAEQEATEEEVRVAAALRWLAEHPGWFLILDNVDTEEAAECVEALLPRLQRGQVLITSRLARWHGQVQPLELDVLAEDKAAEFLLQRTEPQGGRGRTVTADDADHAAALADDLDGLALALEQAGAYIVARRKSLRFISYDRNNLNFRQIKNGVATESLKVGQPADDDGLGERRRNSRLR